jgi:membrane fusion protein (multidrug efflux system)
MKGRQPAFFALLATIALVPFACKKPEPPPPAPPEVTITPVVQQDVPVYVENIGQTRGSEEVDVRARAQGFLEGIHFREGTFVKQGQLLYTIDPRELNAQLENAKGNQARAAASLARATQDVERFKPLVEKNAIPRQDYETALANQSAAKAMLDSSKAMVDQAGLSLGYTRIYAPVSGLIGKSEINVGNLVGSGQNTLLTSISKVDPLRVRFSVSERDYLEFARKYGVNKKTAAEIMSIELMLADGSIHPYKGELTFADRVVDPETGTLLLEASFPNPDGVVRTGQYARVRFATDIRKNAILVPQRAVQEMQATYSVGVVKGNKAEIRTVSPGARVGQMWVIEKGLEPGEEVIVDGIQKVKNGMEVKATAAPVTAQTANAAVVPAKEN